MTALLFPVGHYLGPHWRAGGEAPTGHRVRLGPSLRWLGTDPELLAWTLAHGLGELADEDLPYDRAALAAYAQWLAGTDVTEAVTALVERRLLVEVDPDGPAATEFARSYRLRALMLALGQDPEEPDTVLLGATGAPEVALSALGHAVWEAGQHTPSLWETCQAVAGTDPAAAGEAATLLPELLSELHGLLGAGVAYLDAAEGESHAGVEIH